MYPAFELFGKTIPTYWLCMLIGIAACSIVAFIRRKRFKELQQVDITNLAALLFIGALIGSRLLFLITISPIIVENFDVLIHNKSLAYELLSNGMVFYGGMLGALFVLYRYSRKYELDVKTVVDYFVPLFPLFHCFGRIGCFFTGCCHGIVSENFGICYEHSVVSPNGMPYFPIQLVGSALNILLFIALILFERKHHKQGYSVYAYLGTYAVGRFIIEFFRGDAVRGFFLGVSTSQWISIIILAVLAYKLVRYYRKKA